MAVLSPLVDQADPSIFARMGIADTSPKKSDAASDTAPPDVIKRVRAVIAKGGGVDTENSPSPKPPAQGEVPKFPEMQPLPPPPKREDTPPIEAWGSLAMLAAALGGMRSRTHATTALNAAGEAMKGIHQRDEEKYKDAMENWRVASENQQRMQTYEIETYKAIMGQRAQTFNDFIKLSREQQQEIATQLHAQTVAQGNERIANLLEHQQHEEAYKQLEALRKTNESMQKERDKIESVHTMESDWATAAKAGDQDAISDPNGWKWKYYPEAAKKAGLPKPGETPEDTRGFWEMYAPTRFGGKPAPGVATQSPAASTPQGAPAAPTVPDIMLGGKHLRYNGTGDTRDPKNYTSVQ